MKCPVCSNQLTEREANGFHVDVCAESCGGIWFDKAELDKCDSHRDQFPDELLRVKRNAEAAIDRSRIRNCPRCETEAMERLYFKPDNDFEIDHCKKCDGHWLDIGELEYIRNHSKLRDYVAIEKAEYTAKSKKVDAIFKLIFK